MKSIPRSICDLFDGKHRYVVPLFQRQYVWTRENQWEPLWEDITERAARREASDASDLSPHFLGAMVLDQMKTFGNQVTAHTIIDGQQRLTTFQIFLAAFRDIARQTGAATYADEVERYVRNTGLMENPEVEQFKVFPTRSDQEQFRDVMTSGSVVALEAKYPPVYVRRRLQERPRMVEGYIYFARKLEDYFTSEPGSDGNETTTVNKRVETLYQALRSDLQVVSIELEGKDDPQLIFETLNARGEPLLPSDLLRNNIFRRAERRRENSDALYLRYWQGFEDDFWRVDERQGRLVRPRIDVFMQHFLALKRGTDVNLGRMFREYREWIEAEAPEAKPPYESVEEELIDLTRYAGAFRKVIVPDTTTRFGKFIERLQRLDVRTIYPLALFLLADTDLPPAEFDGIASDLESYVVRRAVCGKTTKNYNNIFLSLVRGLQQTGVSRENLRRMLLGFKGEAVNFPDDTEFRKAWLSTPVYETLKASKVATLLRAIEDRLHSSYNENVTITGPLTVEHVMPQSWEENWSHDVQTEGDFLGDGEFVIKATEVAGERAQLRDQMLQTFGNLTLLTHSLNSSVSNGAYSVKRPEIVGQSRLRLNTYFQNVDRWDEAAILDRGKELFEVARQVWAYPAEDTQTA